MQVKVEMGDEKIVRSKAVKSLGVVIDDELNWKEQVQNVRRKCFTGLANVRRLKNVLATVNSQKQLYNSLVLPHMDYWLERVHNYGMRLILSKHPGLIVKR